MLPEDSINKIMLFNSHPIADMFKQSSSHQYRELREVLTNLHQYAHRVIVDFSFEVGCANGYSGKYMIEDFCNYNYSQLFDNSPSKQCVNT